MPFAFFLPPLLCPLSWISWQCSEPLHSTSCVWEWLQKKIKTRQIFQPWNTKENFICHELE